MDPPAMSSDVRGYRKLRRKIFAEREPLNVGPAPYAGPGGV